MEHAGFLMNMLKDRIVLFRRSRNLYILSHFVLAIGGDNDFKIWDDIFEHYLKDYTIEFVKK